MHSLMGIYLLIAVIVINDKQYCFGSKIHLISNRVEKVRFRHQTPICSKIVEI